MKYTHVPVLVNEVLQGLDIKEHSNVIDATVGGGGHAKAILEQSSPDGFLLGLDWDKVAVDAAKENLAEFGKRVVIKNDSYINVDNHTSEVGDRPINAILADLGLSSAQLDDKRRGFSFLSDSKLSMRFDNQEGLDAKDIVNTYSEKELVRIFQEYGEESLARNIAKEICKVRNTDEVTGSVLSDICKRTYAMKFKKKSTTHPATRVWQALRIEVNQEFENIKNFIPKALNLLEPGGRLGIITFHSLEDALVKKIFRSFVQAPPPDLNSPLPEEFTPTARLITRKSIKPTEEEVRENLRARSAQLRIIEKI